MRESVSQELIILKNLIGFSGASLEKIFTETNYEQGLVKKQTMVKQLDHSDLITMCEARCKIKQSADYLNITIPNKPVYSKEVGHLYLFKNFFIPN